MGVNAVPHDLQRLIGKNVAAAPFVIQMRHQRLAEQQCGEPVQVGGIGAKDGREILLKGVTKGLIVVKRAFVAQRKVRNLSNRGMPAPASKKASNRPGPWRADAGI